MTVSIIIVNYNTANYVKMCIESIRSYSKDCEYEIIVVDNNSPDKSINSLEIIYKDVKFYYKNINEGFGSGCNFGALKSSGKYLFFLNPDVCFVSDIVKVFYNFMEKNVNTGVCSTLIMGLDKEYQYCFNDFPSIAWELLELTGYYSNKKIRKEISKAQILGDKGIALEIDWAIGACIFIRREIFENIMGFNEKFFLYYEDTDLQKRIKDLGNKIILLGNQKVLHLGKSSIEDSEHGSNIYFNNMHKSKLLYYKLHKGLLYSFIVRFINIIAIILRILILPFRNLIWNDKKNKFVVFKNILKIYLSFKNV